MKFIDVFPYDRSRYPELIHYFEYAIRSMPTVLKYFSIGGFLRFDDCGLGIPDGEDDIMREGPFAWYGDPSIIRGPEDFEIIDFKMFIVCVELAVRVFIFNSGKPAEESVLNDLEELKKKYTDVSWIKEHCYGEGMVYDNQLVQTGEYHGKEWGEEWYEKYGKFLRFDDVDEIVNFAWERGLKRGTGGSVKLSNEKYNVEISFDDTYTPGSADNKNVYDKVFNPFGIPGRQKYFKVLDISISDKMGGKLRAAVICEYMTFSDNCIIRENDLVIMSENDLISFGLERAEICRVKSLDIGGETLGLYPYKDGFIIHGETEIAGVSGDFKLLWSFSGEDIFATLDGSSAFEMDGDGITARDFSGKVYRIGYDGRKI